VSGRMRGLVRSASVRLFGEPPGRDTPRLARLCWLRRMYLVMFLVGLPAYALVVFVFARATWVYIAVGAAMLLGLQGVISISIRIRRERRRELT
jgi:hypothetical protein